MSEPESLEYRSFETDLEVRSAAGGKRTLCGILVPYGVDQRIDEGLTERFERGAFTHQFRAARRVPLLSLHSVQPGSMQVGYATTLRDDAKGLYGEFRVTPGPWGDQYLGLISEGEARQWSIGFADVDTRDDGRVKVRVKARLFETALVPQGAYGELAQVAMVRQATPIPVLVRDTLLARLPKPGFPA